MILESSQGFTMPPCCGELTDQNRQQRQGLPCWIREVHLK
ncbi:hypothetical protein SynBIOSE41_02896 [Synechococcus sp. BIOS-E4-1]|nr:hypothetical protein SynBIOSE41_02896 [Synechococcus sp. BIOS-E4-1]